MRLTAERTGTGEHEFARDLRTHPGRTRLPVSGAPGPCMVIHQQIIDLADAPMQG